MNFEFLIYLLILLIAVIVIFKVIKKLIFAILTVITLFILVFVGIGALVYADYNYLSSNENFTIDLVYQKEDSFVLGVEIPFENSEMKIEKAKSIGDLNSISKSIKSKDNKFLVIIDEELFEKLISNRQVSLTKILPEEQTQDLNLQVSGSEIIELLDSELIEEELILIIIEENEIPLIFQDVAVSTLEEAFVNLESELGMEAQELIFLLSLYDSVQDEKNILSLIEGFKKGTLEVYPNRFVFRLVKLFPVDTIRNFLPDNLNIN